MPPPGVYVVTKVLPCASVVVMTWPAVGACDTGAVVSMTEPDLSVVVRTTPGAVVEVVMVEPAELVVVMGMATLTEGLTRAEEETKVGLPDLSVVETKTGMMTGWVVLEEEAAAAAEEDAGATAVVC